MINIAMPKLAVGGIRDLRSKTEEVQKKVEESKDSDGRVFASLSELNEGANKGKMVLLKLLISAIRTDNPPA